MSNSIQLDITWDPIKAQSNIAKHGLTFVQAATVLNDALALTVFDAAHSEFEERWFTLGMSSDGKLLACPTPINTPGQSMCACALFLLARQPGASDSSMRMNPVDFNLLR